MGSLKLAWTAVVLFTLVACGGGGGDSGVSPFVQAASGAAAAAPSLALSISTTTPTAAIPAVVSATVKDSTGVPIGGQIVFFFAPADLGVLALPSALTDANGIATVTLVPASPTLGGAGNVDVTTTVNKVALLQSIGFQVAAGP